MSRLYRRKDVWYFEVCRRGQKKRISLCTKNYRTAQRLAQGMEEKLLRSQLGIELGNSVTVAKLCKSFLESNRAVHSAATASDYRYTVNAHIIPILGKTRTDEVTQVHLNDFIQTMSGKMGKATVNKTIRYLRSILRWGVRRQTNLDIEC